MDKDVLFYKESGRLNALRLLFAYAIGIATVFFISYGYSVLLIFIPLVYLNFIIVTVYAIVLGYFIKLLIRFAQIRNQRSRYVFAVIVGLAAYYFQWTSYILYALSGEVPSFTEYFENSSWIISSTDFIYIIAEINKYGLWEVFGIPFRDYALTFVWIIEAFIILSGALLPVIKHHINPFSEEFNRWYPKYVLRTDFESIATVYKLKESLIEDPLYTLQNLKYGDGARYTKVYIFFLKNEEKQYISFERFFVENRGRGKTKSKLVINNFLINATTAKLILEQFENKRDWFLLRFEY